MTLNKKNRIINIDYERNKLSWCYYIPLLLIAGFVPLIVHGKYIDLTGTTQALYWTGQNQLLDFFSYWKSRWVIFLTATALVIYIFLLITKKLPFKKEYKYYIPLAIYAVFVILSTIFAIDVPTALNGFVDMYQGMWVLLSYVLLTFLTINFVNSERDVKLFLYAFIFLIIVEGLIGVGQYFGFDIFNTKFGNSLIIPSGINVDGGLTFNFGKHTIYGTLFNTNFVGSFATLMLPMAVVFLISAKGWKKRVVAGIALLLCLFTWIGCNSRAGYLGVAFSFLLALIMLRKYILKYWKYIFGVTILCIIILYAFNAFSEGYLTYKLKSMNPISVIEDIKNGRDNRYTLIEDITVKDNLIAIKTDKEILKLRIDKEKVSFLDEKNFEIPIIVENNTITMDDERYKKYKITIAQDYPVITVAIEELWKNRSMDFYISENDIKVLGSGGRITDVSFRAPKLKSFEGIEEMASGRGYIWGYSIPLISNYFIIGAGADNYIYAFPQDDVIAKLNVGMSANTVVDKPHNMYIQIAINTGIISLVSLLIAWMIYIISSIKLYWRMKLDSFDKCMGLSCLMSVIAYLASAIFNDYIVSVSPLFWLILGVGISVNLKLKKKEEKNI